MAKRKVPGNFKRFGRTLKLSKGRKAPCCNRKAALRMVARGASPEDAIAKHCPGSCQRKK